MEMRLLKHDDDPGLILKMQRNIQFHLMEELGFEHVIDEKISKIVQLRSQSLSLFRGIFSPYSPCEFVAVPLGVFERISSGLSWLVQKLLSDMVIGM